MAETEETKLGRAGSAWRFAWVSTLTIAATAVIVWLLIKIVSRAIQDGNWIAQSSISPTLWIMAVGGVILAASNLGRKVRVAGGLSGVLGIAGLGVGLGFRSWGTGKLIATVAAILIWLLCLAIVLFVPIRWLWRAWNTTWLTWKAWKAQEDDWLLLNEKASTATSATWMLLFSSIEWLAKMRTPRVVWERLLMVVFPVVGFAVMASLAMACIWVMRATEPLREELKRGGTPGMLLYVVIVLFCCVAGGGLALKAIDAVFRGWNVVSEWWWRKRR